MSVIEIPITSDDELARLRAKLSASDLERIRLRDTLRIACERLTATGDEADRVWTASVYERWFK